MGSIGNMMGWGGGWGFFGALHMVLWWVLVVLGIVVLVRWLIASKREGRGTDGDRALDILRERYARGEIEKDEFESRRRDLQPR